METNSEIELLKDSHWDQNFLFNDLMAPMERYDQVITIYTLEFLDQISPNIKMKRENLQPNYLMDGIFDFKEIYKYKCGNRDEKSKYPTFCTKKELKRGGTVCDVSAMFKTACDSSSLNSVNNCYSRAVTGGSCLEEGQ